MANEEKFKSEDEKCASLTTILGIIFLFFGFSQKACLNFEEKRCYFVWFSNTAASFISRREKYIFPGTGSGQVVKCRKISIWKVFGASFLSYFQVKVNAKECLFDKSSWPHDWQFFFSSLKNKALDGEHIFNNTRSGASIHSKYFLSSSELSLFIFRSTCPLNVQEIFCKLKWLYAFYLRDRMVWSTLSYLEILRFFAP